VQALLTLQAYAYS